MKKILFGALMLTSMAAMAQETYTNADLITEDLNGTARYVGMGGALEALGADISTIGTNPAGIGLFRRSVANVSAGLVSQDDCGTNPYGDQTNASFDQIGFVWANRFDRNTYINFAFNYKKNRNFNDIFNVEGFLDGASQNKNSYMNLMDAHKLEDWNVSQLDAVYYNTLVGDKDGNLYFNDGDKYALSRATKGYAGEYDFNFSGNVSNRVYLGMTLGIVDVNFKSWTAYSESLLNYQNANIGDVTVNDYRETSGTGVNMKFGAIVFPVEDNPFRLGFSIATPTWYEMNTYSNTSLSSRANTGGTPYDSNYVGESEYQYRFSSPWKFGVSMGTTLDNFVALGASYEYADYGYTSFSIIDDDFYDDDYKDADMNMHAETTLSGVSTLKLGMEVKPTPQAAIRLGYNYVSPMYRQEGFRDGTLWSPGTFYSSTTDYTNWKATNRVTCGFGYNMGNCSLDVAYQYSQTNGNFRPFMESSAVYEYNDGTKDIVENFVDPVKVSKKRHQLLATFTYKF